MTTKNTPKISLDQKKFDETMKRKKFSISVLNKRCGGVTSEGMIRRARKNGEISPEVLDKIAECLNVTPEYLSESKSDESKLTEDFSKLLRLQGITESQYKLLSEKERQTLHEEIFSAIQRILHKYF